MDTLACAPDKAYLLSTFCFGFSICLLAFYFRPLGDCAKKWGCRSSRFQGSAYRGGGILQRGTTAAESRLLFPLFSYRPEGGLDLVTNNRQTGCQGVCMCHLRRLFGISFFDKRPRAATCRNGATMARAKALFADVDLFTVSIRPEPPKTGRAVTAETQTAPIAARDVGTSVAVAVEMGSQTETHSSSQTTSSSGGDEGKEADSGDADKERADAESALAMRRLAPSMLAELSRSADSTALQGYPPPPLASGLSGVSSSGNGGASSHHCTLKPPAGSLAARQRLQCTGVGWNAGGTVVCASFGNLATSGWCLQGGSLCAWPVFRRGFDASSAPEVVLEHSSCLMSLACHPTQPSLVACGSFNGEVLLFDLSVASKSRHRQSAGQAATLSEVGGSEHKEADNSSRDSDPTSRGESDDPLVFASKVKSSNELPERKMHSSS